MYLIKKERGETAEGTPRENEKHHKMENVQGRTSKEKQDIITDPHPKEMQLNLDDEERTERPEVTRPRREAHSLPDHPRKTLLH